MICLRCTADLPESEFPTLLKGGASAKCWRCTNWRLNRAAKDCPKCGGDSTVGENTDLGHPILTCSTCGHSFLDRDSVQDLQIQ